MFIMVHDLELSVSGQVYLGETWALTTSLQQCSKDRVIVRNFAARIDSITHGQCDYCSYLVYRAYFADGVHDDLLLGKPAETRG